MNSSEIDAILDAGIEAHAAGDFVKARACYEKVHEAEQDNPDALHLLGVLANQRHDFEESIRLITQAIAIASDVGEYYNNLGESLNVLERFDEAITAFENSTRLDGAQVNPWRKLGMLHQTRANYDAAATCFTNAATIDPLHVETLNNLGVSLRHLGRFKEAEERFRSVLGIDQTYILARQNLSRALYDQGLTEEALICAQEVADAAPLEAAGYIFQARALNLAKKFSQAIYVAHRALKIDKDAAEGHYQLGVAFEGIGEHHGAVLAFNRTAELEPKRFAPQMNLGLALLAIGDLDRAVEAFEAGTAVNENSSQLWFNLTVAYERRGSFKEAIRTATRLVELKPGEARPLAILGTMYMRNSEYNKAEEQLRAALAINSKMAEAFDNLANIYAERGDIVEAVRLARQAVEVADSNARPHGALLMYMNAHPDLLAQEIFDMHMDFQRRYAEPIAQVPLTIDRSPERKLRIAFISPDLRAHSVAFFLSSLLSCYDRSHWEVTCYDNSSKPDDITRQLRKHVTQWHRIIGSSDEDVVARIQQDKIDILIDLAGHTGDNRLLVMAARPAPIQVTYLGYPNTTGLTTVDYRLTDAYADPPGLTDAFYTEKLLRLPNTFLCYTNVPDVPEPSETPALANGYVTFGSFNMLNKLNRRVVALWAKILHQTPTAKLLLKAAGLSDPASHAWVNDLFLAEGIGTDRLILRGKQPTYGTHLQMYTEMDIALDPFPYNGTTTTCEALWCGVPVITLAGTTHVSRVGVSLLSNLKLDKLIGATGEDYVRIAVELAQNTDELRALRSGMRERMRTSPLMDAPAFAANFDAALRTMWRTYCGQSV